MEMAPKKILPVLIIEFGFFNINVVGISRGERIFYKDTITNNTISSIYQTMVYMFNDEHPSHRISLQELESVLQYNFRTDFKIDSKSITEYLPNLLEQASNRIIKYLTNRLNDLLDFNNVLFTGAYKEYYYPYIKPHLDDRYIQSGYYPNTSQDNTIYTLYEKAIEYCNSVFTSS